MKPFNLELAKQEHPVQTRDGRPARIICFDRKDKDFPIVALVESISKTCEFPQVYTNEGKIHPDGRESGVDLVMTTIKKEGWIDIFHRKGLFTECHEAKMVYPTEEEAKEAASGNADYVATIKISWEE